MIRIIVIPADPEEPPETRLIARYDRWYVTSVALDNISYSKEERISILQGALHWLVIHKRNSGAGNEAIERQRATNLKLMDDFITKDEVGIY